MVKITTIAPLPSPSPAYGRGTYALAGFDFGFDFHSPAAAPSIADEVGVFGEDCLRAASPSSAAARFGEKRRK